MKQKHFIEIQNIREEDTELRNRNTQAFDTDCIIQITEKFDGSNACACWDSETNQMVAFSRKQELNYSNTLNGFWNYVQDFSDEVKNWFKKCDNYRVYGEWNCLSGDTIIRKTSAGKNNAYMTLRDMYKFLHTPTTDKFHYNPNRGHLLIVSLIQNGINSEEEIIKKYQELNPEIQSNWVKREITKCLNKEYIYYDGNNCYYIEEKGLLFLDEAINGKNSWWNRHGMPSIFSLYQDEWKIKPNKILDIRYTGDKEVYEVVTKSGFKIKSTKEHKFLTPYGFKSLEELKEKDCVAITRFFNEGRMSRTYGKGTKQLIDEQKKYKEEIGKCEICGLDTCLELHHKDGNYLNNNRNNWQILCTSCHKKITAEQELGRAKFEYNVEFDYIVSITKIGVEDCYDIMMEGDENNANFVANGFVVHNCKNKIIYNDTGKIKHWYVYDIYNDDTKEWLPQSVVKHFCEVTGLEYIHELYYGKFMSWEHCRSFMNSPAYGDRQEGIIIKNQSRLINWDDHDIKAPCYLKIVNESFKESIKTKEKIIDLEKENAKEEARKVMESICTKNRIEKELFKMRDEGILPEKIEPTDFRIIAMNLPKRIYADLLKEELELVQSCGEFGGKMCQQVSMQIAKDLILGK